MCRQTLFPIWSFVFHCLIKTGVVFMSCIVQSKPALCLSCIVQSKPALFSCLALSSQNRRCVYVWHCPVKTSVLFSLFSVSISFQNAGSPLASDHFDGLGVIPVLKWVEFVWFGCSWYLWSAVKCTVAVWRFCVSLSPCWCDQSLCSNMVATLRAFCVACDCDVLIS